MCIAFVDVCRLLLRSPAWTRPFISEYPDKDEIANPKLKKRLPYGVFLICGLSGFGFAVQVASALHIPSAIMPAVSWVVAALLIGIRRPRTAPIGLLGVYVGICVSQITWLASRDNLQVSRPVDILAILSTILSLACFTTIVNMPLRSTILSQSDTSRPFTSPTNNLRSPEDNLTPWQWMTVSWMSPLISTGSKRQLNDEDVWSLSYEFQHRHLHDAFRELKGTVVRRLIRANWIDLLLLSILAVVELVANYSTPVLLQQLLKSMENIRLSARPAVTYTVLTLLVQLVAAQSSVFSLWFGRRCYERSRGEMITMLYEKTLARKIIGGVQNEEPVAEESTVRSSTKNMIIDEEAERPEDEGERPEDEGLLSGNLKQSGGVKAYVARAWQSIGRTFPFGFQMKNTELEKKTSASMGKILNLMRNDVYEVAQRFWEFQTLVNKPIGLVLSIVLIWRLIGWPCMVGVAIVIIAQAANALLARQLIHWERIRRKATDAKLQEISQFVEAIRHLRWYGWHPTWLKKIMDARQKELNLRVITYLWNIAITFVNTLGSGMLPVAAFYAYTALAGHDLRIDVAFPALQLFGLLQNNLREIPNLITVLLNASVAVGRIEDFMSEPDKTESPDQPIGTEVNLGLKNASFAWPGAPGNVLRNITLELPPGLNVVFGEVAAGKTALLQALLGELDLRDGEIIKPSQAVAFCAQTPWLQSMSIRENILFSSPYEDSRYKRTLEACALTADLANFKHGDLSNIGENGIGLSGGQKARVALARAVYSRAKTILLDDPLSALDQQTAESIVAKCLGGDLIIGRTIILVTHRTDLCRGLAQQWIEVSHGTVRASEDSDTASNGLSLPLSVTKQHNGNAEHMDKVQEAAAVPDDFIEEEHRAQGGVKASVYWEYVKAGKLRWWSVLICLAALYRLLMVGESWFLKEWGEAYNNPQERLFTVQQLGFKMHTTSSPLSGLFDRFPDPAVNVKPWLIGLFIIVLAQSVAILVSQSAMLVVTYSAGRQMFRDIMKRVSNATFRFYDITPVGRLMNRLTSDIGTVDGNISNQFHNVAWHSIAWISSIIVIASVTPLFLIFSLALTAAFIIIFLRFLPTSQSLRRLEVRKANNSLVMFILLTSKQMVSLSPLMSNFGALLDGLTTVRGKFAPAFGSRY